MDDAQTLLDLARVTGPSITVNCAVLAAPATVHHHDGSTTVLDAGIVVSAFVGPNDEVRVHTTYPTAVAGVVHDAAEVAVDVAAYRERLLAARTEALARGRRSGVVIG